jgi:hypothetical protein
VDDSLDDPLFEAMREASRSSERSNESLKQRVVIGLRRARSKRLTVGTATMLVFAAGLGLWASRERAPNVRDEVVVQKSEPAALSGTPAVGLIASLPRIDPGPGWLAVQRQTRSPRVQLFELLPTVGSSRAGRVPTIPPHISKKGRHT